MQDRWVRNVFNPNWVRSKNGLYEIIGRGYESCLLYSMGMDSKINKIMSDFNSLNFDPNFFLENNILENILNYEDIKDIFIEDDIKDIFDDIEDISIEYLEYLEYLILICRIIKKLIELIKEKANTREELLDRLIPTCYCLVSFSTEYEKRERLKLSGFAKEYEDKYMKIRDDRPAYHKLLRVAKSRGICLKKIKSLKELNGKKDERVIVLGGPAANECAAELLKSFQLERIDFNLQSPLYELIVGGKRYVPDYDENRRTYKIDYALYIGNKVGNNYVIGVMGCHGIGTIGAIKALTNPTKLKGGKEVAEVFAEEVAKKLEKEEPWYVVIAVKHNQGKIEKVKVKD